MMIQNKTDRPMSESYARRLDVKNRNIAADGCFVYAVKTTGIYCRPYCPAKNAKRENIEFFDSYQEAERAHYRACKRCKPNGESIRAKNRRLVIEGCRLLEEENGDLTLSDLAAQLEISPHFFQRQFKKITGVTPKQYSKAIRTNNLQAILTQSDGSITDTIYNAGFNSSSQFYETSDASFSAKAAPTC